MPSLGSHHASDFTKLLFIGDSGGGKTGGLASLAMAGYKLRILDCDNGLDILKNVLQSKAPQCLNDHPRGGPWVHYISCQEPMTPVGGKVIVSKAEAFRKAMNALTQWKDEDGTDLGKPSAWGADTILVIDSLTFLCHYAMNHWLAMNNRLNDPPRIQDWGGAQGLIENTLGLLYGKSFATNVVVNAHITYIGRKVEETNDKGEKEEVEKDIKAYPMSLGRALSPKIGTYFNHALLARTQGEGPAAKRFIFTNTQGLLELKTTAPGVAKSQYPIETGLAEYFKLVRGTEPKGN